MIKLICSFKITPLLLSLFFVLFFQNSVQGQIFTAATANVNAGNPDAIVPVTGEINGGVFLAQSPEACIQGDGINDNGYGEDPEWRFDIAIPTTSGAVSPSCSDIEIRVCRRGDFGHNEEAIYIYDESFNEIGLIPGHPSNSFAFDCTNEPICTIISIDPCAFNDQIGDGNWSVTLYTNGGISGNTVSDVCDISAGPQEDGDAENCVEDCSTYTQAVVGIFDNQASGGPMINTNCTGCNCAFIDYLKMDITISDTTFTMSSTHGGINNPITLTPASGLICPQDWTVNGGTTGLTSTSGTTTFTASTTGIYTICNNVGQSACQAVNCKTITIAEEICDNGIDDDFDGLIDCNDPDCSLSGSCDVCYEESPSYEYKINSLAAATSYTWTVPNGAVITDQPADTFIIVDYSAAVPGLDSVKVVASDGICDKDSISFFQNIIFCNDPPVAVDDLNSTNEDTSVTIAVAENDFDIDGNLDTLTVIIVSNPVNGVANVNPSTGHIDYTPSANYNGLDSLEYSICDTEGLCDTATLVIDIFPIADGVLASDDIATLMEDMAATTDVLANDNDPDNDIDTSSVAIVTPPTNGTTLVNPSTGEITYTANLNFNGIDSYDYQVCDLDTPTPNCNTATVFVTVDPVNDAPIAVDDNSAINEDTPTTINVAANDNDSNDPAGGIDSTSVAIITPSANGTSTVDPITGEITYEPNMNFHGSDSLTYQICDTGNPLPSLCDTATVFLNILSDTDEDGIVDITDLDDDNDGIPDVMENGGVDPTGDDDNDGIYNYQDTNCTNCSYASTDDNNDGIPDSFDFDRDGIPNSYDLDSDLDGIADVIEAGGDDADGNGLLDGFADINQNGLADLVDPFQTGQSLPMWNTDGTGSFNFLDIDSDGDGLVDNIESQPTVGYLASFNIDTNGNGWDDAYDGTVSGTPVPLTNTDGSGNPDFMDLDSDNDGLPDAVEGHDANHDGIADTFPSGEDDDADGLDNAYDLFFGITTTNSSESNAPIQDTDVDTQPDYRDIDSDNDGISDNDECPSGSNCPDIDNDGIPNYLDLNCNSFLAEPEITITNPVCETDTIVMFVQNEYLTNILQMDTSDIMFFWFNGNGDTIAIQQESIYAIAATDLMAISPFSVQVTVEGCISPISDPEEVEVAEIPIVTATNNGPICEGDAVQLSADFFSNATYEWRVEGTTAIISIEREPILNNVDTTTIFEVTVYITPCIIPGVATTTVEVKTLPTVSPVANYTLNSDCSPADLTLMANAISDTTLTFEWTGPNGFISNEENPTIANVSTINNGSYTVIVYDVYSCSSQASVEVDNISDVVTQPIITATPPTCDGGTMTLSVTSYSGSNVVYTWTTPNNVTTNIFGLNSNEIIISPVEASIHTGDYSVEVTVDDCIVTSDIFNIVFPEQPQATPSYTIDGDCQSGNLQLFANATNVSGNVNYEWTGPNGFTSNSENPFLNNALANANGDYNLIVTNNNSCSFSTSILVTGLGTPPETPLVLTNSPVCENGNIHFSLAQQYPSNATINWFNAQGDTIGNELVLDLAANAPNAISPYTVVVGINDCYSDVSEQTTIQILPEIAITAFNSSPICEGEDVQLFTTEVPNATYQWYIAGTTTLISNEQNPIITAPNTSTGYFVEVTSDYECLVSNASFTTVQISQNPIISNVTGGGTYCQGEEITLLAEISNEVDYTWTGPNGFTENGTTGASAPFAAITTLTGNVASGTYTLKTISSVGCESDLETLQIDITPALGTPELVVSNAEICEGDLLQLNSSTYNGANVNYNWFFESTQIATTSSPTHLISNTTPANTGLYSVKAIADGCESPVSNIVYVDVYGVTTVIEASNSSDTDAICEGENVQLELPFMTNATYEWFGPGGYTSNSINPFLENISANQAGDYFAIITLNGCADIVSTTTTVLVNPTPETPTITNDGPICEGDSLSMTVSSPLIVPLDSSMIFSWYAATTNQLLGETYEPFFTINNASSAFNGEYYMIMTVDGCPAEPTDFTLIEINETPVNNANAGEDIEICGDTFINLAATVPTIGIGIWTSSTGATISNPEIANTEVLDLIFGENIFIWTLSNNACGNYDTDTMIVTVTQPSNDIADAGIDFEVCNTDNLNLVATTPSAATGTWTQTNDQASQGVIIVDPNNPNSSILGLENGNTYTFNWSLSEGNCIDFSNDEVVIIVDDIPIENAYISIQDYFYLCEEEEINLEAIAPINATGLWTNNTGALIVNAELNNTIAADLAMGENRFIWSLSNGVCENYSSDTVYVIVEEQVEANVDTFNIIFNDSLMNTNLLVNDYIGNVSEWNISISKMPRHGSFDLSEDGVLNYIPNNNFFGSDTLIYRLCNINCLSECDTAMVTFNISGIDASGECFTPNLLTPNKNGVNDFFTIPCLDAYKENNLTIFNRWGDEVYRASPYLNDWNGTYKGNDLPAGTYFYILDIKVNGISQKIQGYITLFR